MIPEITNNPPQPTDSKQSKLYKLFKPDKPCHKRSERVSSFFFYLTILFFIIGFNFSDVMVGNWYQQFMPNLNGRTIVDITFTDSLNGYAVTNRLSLTDSSFILKTTNRGDSWFFSHSDSGVIYQKIQFINQNTGFVGGYIYINSSFHFVKTTNAGLRWFYIDAPFDKAANDMSVLSNDTIWFTDSETTFGGVFFTSNGGVNWQQQLNLGPNNPNRIYMYNARIGFICKEGNPNLLKTTNSGQTWNIITGTGTGSFRCIFFTDSLTGWKAKAVGGGGWVMGKTTDGGFNWQEQFIPTGTNLVPDVKTFWNMNKDTIWAGGGYKFFPGNGNRGILNYTTNGGETWYFQLPDTSYRIPQFPFIQFINRLNGWAYSSNQTGIHTTNGGDTTFYLPVNQISSEAPEEFALSQNYPNPFNPTTIIRFQINRLSDVKIAVFDIQGKKLTTLVNQKQQAGTYEVSFNGSGYSSGVYFYSLIIDGITVETKKMVLIK